MSMTALELTAELLAAREDWLSDKSDDHDFAYKVSPLMPNLHAAVVALDAEVVRLTDDAAALRECIETLHEHGDFSNGVTDPTGSIDEGVVKTFDYVRSYLDGSAGRELRERLKQAETARASADAANFDLQLKLNAIEVENAQLRTIESAATALLPYAE